MEDTEPMKYWIRRQLVLLNFGKLKASP